MKILGGRNMPSPGERFDRLQRTARQLAGTGPVIIDTPGFRSKTTLECLAAADFVLVPVKPSPFPMAWAVSATCCVA